ncbi:MAG: NAD(P)-dependent alcohol dehydrogenase [Rhodothermales bacterium]|nr:NAD(P)-dependent alcohol dehydrogenase [Rhodothermales bacterium]
MKAVTYTEYGPPEVLSVSEVDRPELKSGEILVRNKAAEATKADCEMRSFQFPVKWFWVPLRIAFGVFRPRRQILGGYFAGEVEEVGDGVSRFAPGDAVFGNTGFRFGAYGQYLALPEDGTIATRPANMSFEEAAAVPLGGLNALHFMRRAKLSPGDKVLVNGAGGSIGAHAVQIAKSMGAEVSAVDSGIKRDFLLGLGADVFFDYAVDDFGAEGRTFDVIFDMVAGSSFSRCINALKPGGRYLSGNPRLSVMLRCLLTSAFTDKTCSFAFARESVEELTTLRDMIEAGSIRSIVDRVLPMEEAPAAHRLVETEQRIGAIVLAIST